MAEPETQVQLTSVEMPPRKGRLETYLWDDSDEVALEVAQCFYNPERPISPTTVLIPIAAHQEANNIFPALTEYANQKDAEPFTVCLLLNHPNTEEEKALESEMHVRAAQKIFPELDIRYARLGYEKQTPIGQIRKDLWDAALHVVLTDGLYDGPGCEVIGINHDIDTVSISPHYIRNIQRYYRSQQEELNREELGEMPLPTRFTQVKHAYPFDTHPNIAKAMFWIDFRARQMARYGEYEEGLVIPFSTYAAKRGFKANSKTHETSDFAPRNFQGVPGTGMDTSPRRYIARLGEHGVRGIWTEESFTDTDDCRVAEKLPADITHRQLEDTVMDMLDDSLFFFSHGVPAKRWQAIITGATLGSLGNSTDPAEFVGSLSLQEEIFQELAPKFNLARRVLESLGLHDVAQLIDESTTEALINDIEADLKQGIRQDLLIFKAE